MKIGELSRATGFSVETLRYYERIGLIPAAHRDGPAHRDYGPEMVDWLGFLDRLRVIGVPIQDQLAYARRRERGPETAPERRALLVRHREALRARIAELGDCLDLLDAMIATCDAEIDG